jgi:hypothetical protein
MDQHVAAASQHRHVGRFLMPNVYTAFSATAAPKAIREDRYELLTGVSAKCVPFRFLRHRQDWKLLRNSHAMLQHVENYRELVANFGEHRFDNKAVQEVWVEHRDAAGQPVNVQDVNPTHTRWVLFQLAGEAEPREMLHVDYLAQRRFKLIPQVVCSHNRSVSVEELQLHTADITVRISQSDINRRYLSWNSTNM